MRAGFGITALCFTALATTPALAVSTAEIDRYVGLRDAFDTRLGRSTDAAPNVKRAVAGCVLQAFEARGGAGAVSDVLSLLSVVSTGAEFDNPVIVGFNEKYGDAYRQTLAQCRQSAG